MSPLDEGLQDGENDNGKVHLNYFATLAKECLISLNMCFCNDVSATVIMKSLFKALCKTPLLPRCHPPPAIMCQGYQLNQQQMGRTRTLNPVEMLY